MAAGPLPDARLRPAGERSDREGRPAKSRSMKVMLSRGLRTW